LLAPSARSPIGTNDKELPARLPLRDSARAPQSADQVRQQRDGRLWGASHSYRKAFLPQIMSIASVGVYSVIQNDNLVNAS
jgi:hypothetical protein